MKHFNIYICTSDKLSDCLVISVHGRHVAALDWWGYAINETPEESQRTLVARWLRMVRRLGYTIQIVRRYPLGN